MSCPILASHVRPLAASFSFCISQLSHLVRTKKMRTPSPARVMRARSPVDRRSSADVIGLASAGSGEFRKVT